MNMKIVTPEEREICRFAPDSLLAQSAQLRLGMLRLARAVNKDVVKAETLIKRLTTLASALKIFLILPF